MIRTTLPEEMQQLIYRSYIKGETQNSVAKICRVSVRQVRNVLYNAGLSPHPDNGSYIEGNKPRKASKTAPNELSNRNVLIIPDLHSPFIREGFLEFCVEMKEKWSVPDENIYQAGDLIDNHYSSFHDTDPDGMGGRDELEKAIEKLDAFHEAFPILKISYGNHDQIPARKAFNAGLSVRWLRSIDEVLNFSGWEYSYAWDLGNNITLCHGLARQATSRAFQDNTNIIQAHYHSKSYIKTIEDTQDKLWAMQLGAGIDDDSYAAAYGKHNAKTKINVGILIYGKYPIIEWFDEYI